MVFGAVIIGICDLRMGVSWFLPRVNVCSLTLYAAQEVVLSEAPGLWGMKYLNPGILNLSSLGEVKGC